MSEESKVLSIPPIESLVVEMGTRRTQRLAQRGGAWPRRNPIMSDIGDCDRQITYSVTNWADRPAPDTELLARFEVGNIMEREIVRELMEVGFDFIGGQATAEIKGRNGAVLATGKVDGFIKWQGQKIPCEIKTMAPQIYKMVESVDDFQKKPWLRKYTRQLMLYLFANNIEYGIFILTDCLGGRKIFPLYFDYAECEVLLRRLEDVAAHLAAKTLPERIPYEESICGRCSFNAICLNDVIRTEAQVLEDPEILDMIERRAMLDESATEYDAVDKALKTKLRGVKRGLIGDWVIIGTPGEKVAMAADPSLPKIQTWKVDIKRLSDFTEKKKGKR